MVTDAAAVVAPATSPPPVTRCSGMVAAETRSVAGVSGDAETSKRWVSSAVSSSCAVSSVAADTGLVPEPGAPPALLPLAPPEPTTSVGAELASTEDDD